MLQLAHAYFLALQGRGCSRRVCLNEAVVFDRPGNPREAFVDVINLDDWIMPGPNRLELHASPSGQDCRLRGLLAAKPMPDSIEAIASFEDVSPAPRTFDFHVGPPLDGVAESAPIPAQHEIQAIRQQVLAIHAAIRNQQLDVVMDLLQPRIDHLAQRLGLSTSEATARQRAQLEAFHSPDVELAPLDEGAIELNPVCRGMLVRAEVQGRAPIYARGSSDAEGLQAHLPLTFRRAGDRWLVAR